MKPKTTFAAILFVCILGACSKGGDDSSGGGNNNPPDNNNPCAGVTSTFSANVLPIIQSVCGVATCHAAGSFNGPGPLTTYTEVFNARVQIRAAVSSGSMPKNSTLTTAQKNNIICWIDAGALNN